MASDTVPPVLRFIRRILTSGNPGEHTDEHLLARFVARRDEDAFAALVQRHGPMVLAVCSRVLGDVQETEDAFQATFLVLVRRAPSIGRPELLGNWLYGVAYRTARKARAEAARRCLPDNRGADRPTADPSEEAVWRDVRQILDEEVNRLPQKYRIPFVLCHVEGHTHEEVASWLGCPRETVTTRLTRARERLRTRLVRRGLTLSTALLAALLSPQVLTAEVAAPLAGATVKAALLFTAGSAAVPGVLSVQAAVLAEGVVRAMFLTKLKIAAAILLGVSSLAGGAGVITLNALPAQQVPARTEGTAVPPEAVAPRSEDGPQPGRTASVKSLPPVVVQTVPRSGDTQVDARTTPAIRVTFSKEMLDKSWSWAQTSDDTYPRTSGEPYYDKDRRTGVLPVKLEAGKTYVLWLNSAKYGNFKDADGKAAVPYLLVFETKP